MTSSGGAFLLVVGAGGQGDIYEHRINQCTLSLSIGSFDDWALFRGTFPQRLVWGAEAIYTPQGPWLSVLESMEV